MISTKIKTAIFYADPDEALNLQEFGAIFVQNHFIFGTKIEEFTYKNQHFLYVNSSIGLINSALFGQAIVEKFAIKNLINYGSCGANLNFDFTKIKNQLIFPKKFFLLDAKTPWYPPGFIPGEPGFYDNNLLKTGNFNLGSSNSFISKIEQIADFSNIDFFDMEAFSFAQLSYKNNLNFYCIKYPSDQILANYDLQKVNLAIKKGAKTALEFVFNLLDKLA